MQRSRGHTTCQRRADPSRRPVSRARDAGGAVGRPRRAAGGSRPDGSGRAHPELEHPRAVRERGPRRAARGLPAGEGRVRSQGGLPRQGARRHLAGAARWARAVWIRRSGSGRVSAVRRRGVRGNRASVAEGARCVVPPGRQRSEPASRSNRHSSTRSCTTSSASREVCPCCRLRSSTFGVTGPDRH